MQTHSEHDRPKYWKAAPRGRLNGKLQINKESTSRKKAGDTILISDQSSIYNIKALI